MAEKRTGLVPTIVAVVIALTAYGALARAQRSNGWVGGIGPPQYFAVRVDDLDRAVAWYQNAFGLRDLGGSSAPDGSWRIANLGNDALLIEIIEDERTTAVARALGFFKVGFHVADIDAVADRAAATGGERPRIVFDERLGLRILQLTDPDGNTIQISSPPGDRRAEAREGA